MTNPAVEILDVVAVNAKELPAPAPALLAFNVMMPAALSVTATLPVEVRVTDVAFVGFAAETVMPAAPDARLMVPELSKPAVVMPLAPLLAFRENDEPELAFKLTLAAAVSMSDTAPVELALSEVAFIVLAPANVIPALPAVRSARAAFSVPPDAMPLVALLALTMNEDPELPFRVTTPALVSVIETTPVELA